VTTARKEGTESQLCWKDERPRLLCCSSSRPRLFPFAPSLLPLLPFLWLATPPFCSTASKRSTHFLQQLQYHLKKENERRIISKQLREGARNESERNSQPKQKIPRLRQEQTGGKRRQVDRRSAQDLSNKAGVSISIINKDRSRSASVLLAKERTGETRGLKSDSSLDEKERKERERTRPRESRDLHMAKRK